MLSMNLYRQPLFNMGLLKVHTNGCLEMGFGFGLGKIHRWLERVRRLVRSGGEKVA